MSPRWEDCASCKGHRSALYAYKLNWQTVFFIGYGDAEDSESVFMKVAYAFQR